MTLEELKKEKEKIEQQIKDIEEVEKEKRRKCVSKKLESLSDNDKKLILSLMKHDRCSCSDEHVNNGYSYIKNSWRCRKCMLIEIFNGCHGDLYDFDISVEISEI